MSSALMNTYGRQPITFTHGKGVYLFDREGKQYLDAISGVGVNALGHAHPAVTAAIKTQADKLIHTSNLYGVENQELLASRLCAVSGMSNVFFCNSGAEANEAAIKLARLHGHNKGVKRPHIVVMEKAFHGRTMATLTASGGRKIQAGFEPLLSGFTRAPFGDLKALQSIANSNHDVVAVLVEPIQGEGGINLLPAGFLAELRSLCDRNDWLLMLDEVQSGNGRSGRYFAFQHDNILPDVVATAKGLGNGLPIGACLAAGKAADLFHPGNHGSTFGGNPLVCAVATVVVDTIDRENLADNAVQMGARISAGLHEAIGTLAEVKAIRQQGLLIGIELKRDCGELVHHARDRGVLINVTAGNVVRLLPPLILEPQHADTIVNVVTEVIRDFGAH